NTLVCIGAALFVSLGAMVERGTGTARVASYVVSGLGFLGGGVIIREGFSVRGLNTAATLWCTGAIGALAGAGFPFHAAVGLLTVLAVHLALRPLVRIVDTRVKVSGAAVETLYRLRAMCDSRESAVIRSIVLRHVNSQATMTVQGLSIQECSDP